MISNCFLISSYQVHSLSVRILILIWFPLLCKQKHFLNQSTGFLEEDSPKLPRSHQNNPICTFKTSHSDAELDKVSPYKQIIKNTFSRSPWPTVSLQTKPPLSQRIPISICLYLFPAKQINKTFFKLIRLEGSHLKA